MRQIPRQGHFLSPATAATGRLVLAEILDLESFVPSSERARSGVRDGGMDGMREIEGEATLNCAVKENADGMLVGGWKEGGALWLVRCIHSILFSLAHAARE